MSLESLLKNAMQKLVVKEEVANVNDAQTNTIATQATQSKPTTVTVGTKIAPPDIKNLVRQMMKESAGTPIQKNETAAVTVPETAQAAEAATEENIETDPSHLLEETYPAIESEALQIKTNIEAPTTPVETMSVAPITAIEKEAEKISALAGSLKENLEKPLNEGTKTIQEIFTGRSLVKGLLQEFHEVLFLGQELDKLMGEKSKLEGEAAVDSETLNSFRGNIDEVRASLDKLSALQALALTNDAPGLQTALTQLVTNFEESYVSKFAKPAMDKIEESKRREGNALLVLINSKKSLIKKTIEAIGGQRIFEMIKDTVRKSEKNGNKGVEAYIAAGVSPKTAEKIHKAAHPDSPGDMAIQGKLARENSARPGGTLVEVIQAMAPNL